MSNVKLSYRETWFRETTTNVDLDEVRVWAAKPGQDPAEVEITNALLIDYLQDDFDYSSGTEKPGWHPGGNGLEGCEFDGLEVQTAEVVG